MGYCHSDRGYIDWDSAWQSSHWRGCVRGRIKDFVSEGAIEGLWLASFPLLPLLKGTFTQGNMTSSISFSCFLSSFLYITKVHRSPVRLQTEGARGSQRISEAWETLRNSHISKFVSEVAATPCTAESALVLSVLAVAMWKCRVK